jgi:hypothetical protein
MTPFSAAATTRETIICSKQIRIRKKPGSARNGKPGHEVALGRLNF